MDVSKAMAQNDRLSAVASYFSIHIYVTLFHRDWTLYRSARFACTLVFRYSYIYIYIYIYIIYIYIYIYIYISVFMRKFALPLAV